MLLLVPIFLDYKWRHLPELHVNEGILILTQTSAICRYLANSYPKFGLIPTTPRDQARCDQIVEVVQDMRIRKNI